MHLRQRTISGGSKGWYERYLGFDHLSVMKSLIPESRFRAPAEPSPPPVREPDQPENPGVPIREPEPDNPDEI
jgi:hypothetical protein